MSTPSSPQVLCGNFGDVIVVFSATQVREVRKSFFDEGFAGSQTFYDYDLTDPSDPVLVAIGGSNITSADENWGKDFYGTHTRDSLSPNVVPEANSADNKERFLERFRKAREADAAFKLDLQKVLLTRSTFLNSQCD